MAKNMLANEGFGSFYNVCFCLIISFGGRCCRDRYGGIRRSSIVFLPCRNYIRRIVILLEWQDCQPGYVNGDPVFHLLLLASYSLAELFIWSICWILYATIIMETSLSGVQSRR
ncbi:uncharacterized protein LOC122017293 isoform X1 [Zingiber officinale]|uniref:uncharacterized protein LOC122017293 isoform X1 n=1 Tax=Zingiber officinale TaxID=94328 RepID=UPI001C4B6760|nr:uncharacterized protein LOC122017293 isoform X1 [Zingiber officinale]